MQFELPVVEAESDGLATARALTAAELFEAMLARMRTRISGGVFEQWITPLRPVLIDNERLLLEAPGDAVADQARGRFSEQLALALFEVSGRDDLSVSVVVRPRLSRHRLSKSSRRHPTQRAYHF